jgi:hypothetical protein
MRFALMIVLAGTMSAAAADKPTASEQAAMDFVTKSGGKASLDPKLHADARVLAKFDAITDAVLIGMKKHTQIGGVETFDAFKCTNKGFAALKELPHLRKLVLEKPDLTAVGANSIGQCKELRYLAIVNAGLTDAQLASLKELTMLEHLTLSGNSKITDKGMVTVKGFDRLQVLYLAKTSITDDGLMELKVLDGLRTLNVGGTKVTPEAAEKFSDDMPNLRTVRQ